MNPKLLPVLLSFGLLFTHGLNAAETSGDPKEQAIAALTQLARDREAAMKSKDLAAVMAQFSDDATFINNAGYYCANKKEVEKFHGQLMLREDRSYTYLAGKVTVRLLDDTNALVYYPWKMDHFRVATPTEFLIKEIGLMTLSAQKRSGKWMWVAVTNQYTREFFEDLTAHKARL